MGNTLSDSSEGKDTSGLDDLRCLEIQNSAIFNDAFVSEIYGSLPEYVGTVTRDAEDPGDGGELHHALKMKRLLQVFGKAASSTPCVDDFKDLRVDETNSGHNDFLNMVKIRSRLLQRIHIAYCRRLNISKASKSSGASDEKYLRSNRDVGANFDNADALLTATSIKMSLSIMACLGPQNPTLFKDFSVSLMDLLNRSPPLALSKVLSGSPQGESVRAIVDHTEVVIAKSNGADRAQALSLLLALAISSGSLGDVLKLVMHLKDGSETLPPSTAPFLARLEAMTTELKLSTPAPTTIIADFRAKLSLDDASKDKSDFCSTIAGDGVYLFVWDGASRSIVKMGTGFHGTIAGNEYAVNSDVEQQLKDWLGEAVYGQYDNQGGEAAEIEVGVVESSPAAASATRPRRLRMTREGVIYTIQDGEDVENCFANEDFADTDIVGAGFEADIVSEHAINYSSDEPAICMVYGIGENRYIASTVPQEDDDEESSSSDSEESSHNVQYVSILEVIESESLGPRASGDVSARISSGAYRLARIASANGKIYLWMSHLLGPFRVAVFSTSALKLEDIIDVSLPIKELVKGRKRWQRALALASGDAPDGEESKMEDLLQEEKSGEDEEEVEEEETVLGPEIMLSSPGTASISSISSTASSVDADLNLREVLCGSEFSGEDSLFEGEAPFAFASTDEEQTIVIDLGSDYAPSRYGVKLHCPSEDYQHKLFEVLLSSNNIEFFPYGSLQNISGKEHIIGPALETYSGPPEVRYVKYRFGVAPSSEDGNKRGTGIYKLLATGCHREKVVRELPMPVLCSDGRYLIFLTSKIVDKDESDAKLRAITVDPLNGMNVMSDILFDYNILQSNLELTSFGSNGENLVMIHRAGFKRREKIEKDVDFYCVRFNMITQKEENSYNYTFTEKAGYPQAISYDARNNCIWSWDSFENRVLRWRNAGYAPRFLPPRPTSQNELLLSSFPQYRLEALSTMCKAGDSSATAEAAKILCLIDRIADMHSPPLLPMAESKAYDEIEVASAGFDDGCFCRLMHRGQIVHESSRGFNIVLLNDQFEVEDSRSFDTHASETASERLADFIETIDDGTVVLVGIMDSAKTCLSSRAISALKTLGADRIEKLTDRASYALIGRKGGNSNDSSVIQMMMNKSDGPAVVKQRIPSPKIPLAVDSSPTTLKTLVGLISKHYALFKEKKASDLDKVILLSCIRLCTTNVFHLLRGNPSEEIAVFLSGEEKAALISFVMELINDPPNEQGGYVIARAALRLFITAIDVLYVTSAEKCNLLIQYLKEFVDGTLSVLEKSVLELLLRQMSNAVSLAKILSNNDPSLLVASLVSIAEKETVSKMDALASPGRGAASVASSSGVGDASVDMLSTLCNMILSQGVEDFISSPDVSADVVLGVNKIVQLLIKIADISCTVIDKGIEASDIISNLDSAEGNGKRLDKEVDELMKNSPAGALLPIALFSASRIASLSASKFLACSSLSDLTTSLGKCLTSIQNILSKLPKKDLIEKSVVDSGFSKSASTVIESLHPYASNSDLSWELSFPNAIRMTIVFDAETKLENNYDYVIIWKDSSKTEKWHSVEKFTGRGGTENYPGRDNIPPLVIEGNCAHVEFHSDGSNEDWGFKFTCTAEFKSTTTTVQRHWAFDLERQLGYCGSRVASSMITGSWNAQMESPYMNIIDDDMLQGEFRKEVIVDNIPDHMKLLFDLAYDRANPATQDFCKKMKARVIEDRGQVEDINRAVYATAAVLIKFNGLAAEAQALSDGNRDVPSDAMIKVWKSSQKMRHYFDLSDLKAVQNADALPPPPTSVIPDVAEDDDLPPPIGLTRGPSLYSGAGADTKRNASDCVVARCQFLLRIDDTISNNIVDEEGPANPSAGKKMWQLLSKRVVKAVPKLNRDASVENKWHNVVGAAQFANQLKDLISYRRMSAQRKGGVASITERVLTFVQSNASVTQLEQVRQLRDNRASMRAAGLKLINHLIGCNASPFCVSLLVSSVQGAFRDGQCPESPIVKAHYLNSIEGCSPAMCGEVIGHFSNFVRGCTSYILSAYEKFNADGDDKALQKSVLLTCLKSLALDYDTSTHNILLKAQILSMIGSLTKSSDRDISGGAWSLYELLLLRCSGLNHHKEIPDEPSDFTASAVSFLISELEKIASIVAPTSKAVPTASAFPITICAAESRGIKSDSLGFTYPHVNVGIETTTCLWVRRVRSAHEELLSVQCIPAPKMRVIRGPDWDPKLKDDGEKVFNRGTVSKFENGKVSVIWDSTNASKVYKYGDIVDGKKVYEVALIDESVGGHIFSKGSPGVIEKGSDIKWSSFGLSMLPDSRLCFIAANGENNWFTHPSKTRVAFNEWTFVTLVHNTSQHLIYINGELDSETTVPASLIYPEENAKDVHIVESPHPYADNSDDYTVVEVEGCLGYTITFDEQSKTEQNYDFLRFYKNDDHEEYWGEEKYHGGRGSSNRNFPGVGGNPPLHIPASRFVIHFKSDGSNNDWGYKIYCTMELPAKESDNREKYGNLNNLPIYIGQTPSYVTNIDTPTSLDGDICNMGIFPRVLSEGEIRDLKTTTAVNNSPRLDDALCLNMISMLRRSCEIPGAPVSTALSCPPVIYAALVLVARGPHLVAVSALRLCGLLLRLAEPEVVDVQAGLAGLCDTGSTCFIDYLLRTMGCTFNSWQRFLPPDASRPASIAECGESTFGLGWECVLLFHSLLASEKWSSSIMDRIGHVMESTIPSTLEALLSVSRQEAVKPTGELSKFIHVSPADLNLSFGVLGILCGAPDGLNVGAKARCIVGEGEGMLEECTILSPTYPELTNDPLKSLEPRTFGNAMTVVLDSEPTEYIVVDRRNIFPTNRAVGDAQEKFLKAQEGRLQALYTLFVRSDCSDHRLALKPKIVELEKKIIIESKHPYAVDMDTFDKVTLKGAKQLKIEFDPQCRTTNSSDYVRFYKDESQTEHYGESKYFGKDNSQNWPGVPGRDKPALLINGDSFVVHFQSDSNNPSKDWGYKFTVSGHCVEKTDPPMLPPLIHLAVASDMKTYALKSLDFMLRNCAWFIKPVVPLIKDLVLSAMTPAPKFDVGSASMKPIVIESSHPYENSANTFTPYSIRGAKRLVIIFDPQTRTESGCDYVKFYKDSSQTDIWGEQYTGGKDNGSSNWPGMNGRPPLVILADNFVLHFHSDSSVNDWGFKFTVMADGGGGSSDDLDKLAAADRSYRHNCIQQFLLDGPARMPYPSNAAQFATGPEASNPLLLTEDAITFFIAATPEASNAVSTSQTSVERYAMPNTLKKKNTTPETLMGPMMFDRDLVLNRDGVPCRPSMDQFHSHSMLHYCARNVGRDEYSPKYKDNNCCDGACGPTNGCQCRGCAALDDGDFLSGPPAISPDGIRRPADSCPAMHPLVLDTTRNGWSCNGKSDPDGCKSGRGNNASVKDSSRWRCTQCDFDYCGLCLASRMAPTRPSVERRKMQSSCVDQYFISLPADFYVNGRDCSSLKLYADKSTDSSVIGVVGAWEAVMATAEDKDWLYVTSEANQVGWAQRKSRDLVYLSPDFDLSEDIPVVDGGESKVDASAAPSSSSSESTEDLVIIEDERSDNATQTAASKHPMYEVLNDVVAKAGAKKTVLPPPGSVIKGRAAYIENAAVMASTVSSIGYAKSSVTTCLSHWPVDFPFSIDCFGGNTLFLSYIRAAFVARDTGVESGIADESDLDALKGRILELVRAENQSGVDKTCSILINFALRQLNDSLSVGTVLRPTKAVVQHIESTHPYADNMDEWYDVSIPGAKWIKLVFDKQSSMEKDCDYVEVYKDRSKNAKWSPNKYTGRANSNDRFLAGVNSVPACIVNSDNCSIFFHTDSSNTDWGWKITCYGIMEEPTEEEIAAAEEKLTAPGRPRPDMAYWLLDFLAMEQSPMAQQVLFSVSTIKTLRDVMDSAPNSQKTSAIHLITNLLQTIGRVDIPADCWRELELFRKSILLLADSLHRESARSGSIEEVSQVLQATMQAVIVFDTALGSISVKMGAAEEGKPTISKSSRISSKGLVVPTFISTTHASEMKWDVPPDRTDVELSDSGMGVQKIAGATAAVVVASVPDKQSMFSKLTGGFSMGSGGKSKERTGTVAVPTYSTVLGEQGYQSSFSFSIGISAAENCSIGIATAGVPADKALGSDEVQIPSLGWSDQRLSLSGHDAVAFGPKVKSGDIISVVVDADTHTVSFYRNFAYVGLAVGPCGSGAAIEVLVSGVLYPAVTLVQGSACAHFVNPPKALEDFPSPTDGISSENDQTPDWIKSYLETSNMLQACVSREVPPGMFVSTFLPSCEESKTLVIESDHPFSTMPATGRIENIHIEGAQKLIVSIDNNTKMNDTDVIQFYGVQPGDELPDLVEFVGQIGGISACLDVHSVYSSIYAGDRVVRGPAWTWGDQDGGVGNIGTVVNVLAWKGMSGTAVEVVWDIESKLLSPDFTGMYRWGYEGKYDVSCISRGAGKRPLVFNGESIKIEIHGGKKSNSSDNSSESVAVPAWNGCRCFDGISSMIRLPTTDELELGEDFTFEAWVRPASDNDTTFGPLCSRQIEIESRCNQFSVALVKEDGNWLVELSMLNASFSNFCNVRGGIVPVDSWSHIAVTISGNSQTIYVDGVQVASSSSTTGDRFPSMGAMLVIGANEGGQYFKGHMYDVRLWRVNRSEADIQQHKNCRITSPDSAAVLMMSMEEFLPMPDEALLPRFDSTVIQPVLPEGTIYGYKITIKPVFTLKQVLDADIFKADLDALIQQFSLGSLRHDVMLVKYLNQVMRSKKVDLEKILNCAWSEVAPSTDELSKWPVLMELCNITEHSNRNSSLTPTANETVKALGNDSISEVVADTSSALTRSGPDPLENRFKTIQLLNKKLHASMKFIDLCMGEKPWSIAFLLLQCRGLVLEVVKAPFWETALEASSVSGGQFDLKLSRSRAIKHSRTGIPDHDGRFMTFSQAFRAIHPSNPSNLRRSGQLYNTIFLGEYAQDVGGPYRESFAQYCAELQSNSLPLLLRTPNGRQSAGQNREMWVLNPGSTSLTHMEMFAFLGKLMGIAIRGKEYLALNIAPFIWKLLVNDEPTIEDLEGIDYHQVKVLKEIRHTEYSPEIFSMAYSEDISFTGVSTDDRTIDLIPGGQFVPLTYENREEYCNLIEKYKIHEFDEQAEAIRRGLATIVPMKLLSVFTWDQLELMVCGERTVNVALLRSVTEYSSCSSNDVHIRNFWQVLEEFTEEEKAAFLKFTWGRSRLPLSAAAFTQRFKLQSFGKSPPDAYLPVSHTCFFSLELPRYSTIDVMREKLRYAITHCLAIDGDDTSIGIQAAAMGWEE